MRGDLSLDLEISGLLGRRQSHLGPSPGGGCLSQHQPGLSRLHRGDRGTFCHRTRPE